MSFFINYRYDVMLAWPNVTNPWYNQSWNFSIKVQHDNFYHIFLHHRVKLEICVQILYPSPHCATRSPIKVRNGEFPIMCCSYKFQLSSLLKPLISFLLLILKNSTNYIGKWKSSPKSMYLCKYAPNKSSCLVFTTCHVIGLSR